MTIISSHLQNKCKNEFDLIEKDNATKVGNFANEMALKTCMDQNGFGWQNFLPKANTDITNINKLLSNCQSNCWKNIRSETDDQMKSCLNTCINNYYTRNNQITGERNSKLDEFEKMI